MVDEDVERVVVMDDDRLVGICTRTDVLRARSRQFEHERTEPGWARRRTRARMKEASDGAS
jgi:signal-transduction protein with cAMP-binding, CBS, and nucleotidyltransferase domain